MELSLSLQPAEYEVQNIEFIEEELMENHRMDGRYGPYREEGNANKYSLQTLKSVENQ